MNRIEDVPSASKAVTIRACDSHQDLKMCVDLQRRIWNFSDEDLVPTAIFVVARHTGGHAYCALYNDQPAGFALAFSAGHDGLRLWHSHMVGVVPEYQNHGIGRLLKMHQRDEALRLGIPRIEWTFDPLELRNAHFNIARLGAIVRHYIPNCYGETTSPLHRSLPTDRLLAEWPLRSQRVQSVLSGLSLPASGPDAIRISVPARIRDGQSSDTNQAREIQAGLRTRLTDLFSRGYAITAFARGEEHCDYVVEPYED